MRVGRRRSRWLWWLGIVLAGASLFAPGGRDLAEPSDPVPHTLPHQLASILYPTVGQDALVERPSTRIGEPAEPTGTGRPSAAWAPVTTVAALVLLGAAAALARRPLRRRYGRRVPSGRRRGPPRPVWMPRARPAHLPAPA
jgi:hypothetical protein